MTMCELSVGVQTCLHAVDMSSEVAAVHHELVGLEEVQRTPSSRGMNLPCSFSLKLVVVCTSPGWA